METKWIHNFITVSLLKYRSAILFFFIGISILSYYLSNDFCYFSSNRSSNSRNTCDLINHAVKKHQYLNSSSTVSNHQVKTIFQSQFKEYKNKSIVIYNTYRIGANSFSSVGVIYRSRLSIEFFILDTGNCIWREAESDAVLFGKLSIYAMYGSVIFPGDHHLSDYEAIIMNCTFSWAEATYNKGDLYISMEEEQFNIPHQEFNDMPMITVPPISAASFNYENNRKFLNGIMPDGYNHSLNGPSNEDAVYDVAFCSAPCVGRLNQDLLLQWIEYHMAIGVQHFTFYDAGIENFVLHQALSAHFKEQIADVINFTGIRNYDTWNYGQIVSNNDCILRMRNLAKWVLFTDLDEYLTLPYRIESLPSFFTFYKGKACVSFGSLHWDIDNCIIEKNVARNNKENVWAIETLVFRRPTFSCKLNDTLPENCPSFFGHRKVASSPSHMTVLSIHHCLWPPPETSLLVDLNANIAHLNHYRGLAFSYFNISLCFMQNSDISNNAISIPGLFRDDSMVEFVRRIRQP